MFIGKALRELRIEREMSQTELSEEINVRSSTVSRWESDRARPNIESLMKLATLFGVTLEELANGELTA
ncbi:helix-turn-helix transcriptional regulator [Streptomyces sp. IMTB 1903]|uniref:helix-turn-helix transcriptional regulator n=1 Tax=Streptomyces sp. IMTB 1903 TaxID=1776680 RepID=UPI0007569218|nr:helix-turn-helix transcriptional regulator [Streptomyces sp. IMTB 1903]